jgi:hypothetical protein
LIFPQQLQEFFHIACRVTDCPNKWLMRIHYNNEYALRVVLVKQVGRQEPKMVSNSTA